MKRLIISVFLLLILFPLDSPAQQRQIRGEPGRDRFETLRQVKMIEALELDKETAARLTVVYRRHQEHNRQLMEELDERIGALEEALESGASDDEIGKLRSEFEVTQKAIHTGRMQLFRDAEEILTPRQVAQLIVFERNFTREMRTLMREAQRDRRRR
jgi:Spy/CpxP family protein refolding chaperone